MDQIRIGDAERDQVVRALHEAFAQGRLNREELDERLDSAFAAKTFADLRPITADLPEPTGESGATGPGEAWKQGRGQHFGRGRSWGRPHRLGLRAFPMGLFVLAFLLLSIAGGWFFVLPLVFFSWCLLGAVSRRAHAAARCGVHPYDATARH